MNISVILSTYKRPDVLKNTLKSFCNLNTEDIEWELLIVDNAGDDITYTIINEFQKLLPIQFFVEKKPGKNNALNAVILHAKGDLFIFTDDDILPYPNWLTEMKERADRWPNHSVFGGRIIAAWPHGTPFWGDDHPFNQSLFSLHCPTESERPYGEGDFLPYGPNMAIRKSIFDKGYRYNPDIGPTKDMIYTMGSETELLKRLKNDGYIPVFLPNTVVQHQIRPEQLTHIGLDRRNFRMGFSDIKPEEKPDYPIGGVSRYLWKQLLGIIVRLNIAKIKGDKLSEFEERCKMLRIRGKIYAQRHYAGIDNDSFSQRFLSCR